MTVVRASESLSDAQLASSVAARLAAPRAEPADSFVLHAPLELAARVALLPFVAPEHRYPARRRLAAIADQFEASGPPVSPAAPATYPSIHDAACVLVAAIDRGELDDADRAAAWLGRVARGSELRSLLADAVVPRLAAAAHAPIFLYQLPRVAPRGEVTGELLRGLAGELGRYPAWRLEWPDATVRGTVARPEALFDAIAATPRLGTTSGATPFIYPLMSRVDGDGTAARLLAPVTGAHDADEIDELGKSVLRAAAWSMLLEPGDHAPYGWTHCLTLPQAALGVARATHDPSVALAVAATYVVGFRASLATRPLEPVFPTPDPDLELGDALRASPTIAAAAVWHGDGATPQLVTELATRASTHPDAHLVKYTLACFDAAAADPAQSRLYLAAAASLAGWWAQVPPPDGA